MDFIVSLSCIEPLGCEAHWVPFAIVTQLGQYCSGSVAQGIGLQSEWHLLVWLDQDWSGASTRSSPFMLDTRQHPWLSVEPLRESAWRL